MAKSDNDAVSNRSGNPTFEEIVAARISRRGFLGGGLAAAAASASSYFNFSFRRFNRFVKFPAKFTIVSRNTFERALVTKTRNEWLCHKQRRSVTDV